MMLWWLRKTHLALPGYWIFPEDFLEKCYGFWSNLSLDKDQNWGIHQFLIWLCYMMLDITSALFITAMDVKDGLMTVSYHL